MTLPNHDTVLSQFHDLLADHGFDGLADALTVLLNEVMKIERSQHLHAQPAPGESSRHERLFALAGIRLVQTRAIATRTGSRGEGRWHRHLPQDP